MSEDWFDRWIDRQTLEKRFFTLSIFILVELLIIGLGFDYIAASLGLFVGFIPPNILPIMIEDFIYVPVNRSLFSFFPFSVSIS